MMIRKLVLLLGVALLPSAAMAQVQALPASKTPQAAPVAQADEGGLTG